MMAMGESADASAKFVRELADLCEEIARQGYVINNMEAMWGGFGSWSLIVYKGHQAIRFWWDGRDEYLTVEKSPQRNWSAPNEWAVAEHSGTDAPLAFVKDYLRRAGAAKFG